MKKHFKEQPLFFTILISLFFILDSVYAMSQTAIIDSTASNLVVQESNTSSKPMLIYIEKSEREGILDSDVPLVKMKNDSVYSGTSLIYKKRFFRPDLVTLDNRVFKSHELKMYKERNGSLHAYVKHSWRRGINCLNHINLFEITSSSSSSSGSSGINYYHHTFYYCRGVNELKRLSLTNIKKDFSNNTKTMEYAKQATRLRTVSRIALVIASAAIIATIYNNRNTTAGTSHSSNKLNGVIIVGGLGASWFFNWKKNDMIDKAATSYTGYRNF